VTRPRATTLAHGLVLGLMVLEACAGAPSLGPVAVELTVPPPAAAPVPPPPVLGPSLDASFDSRPEILLASDAAATTPPDGRAPLSACNEQPPQDFLVRSNFLRVPDGNGRSIQYRTDTYGSVPGFGHPGAGALPARGSVVTTTFMGLPVRMHKKVVPALRCVEEEIKVTCGEHPYTAHALAGVRFNNTYRGGEVTNHMFGIAIDIDPAINTCCGCVKPWSSSPLCARKAKTEYDRMAMPECWVHAFERYGFYWLGHDVLRDTMHYEFLGDPAKIQRSATVVGGGDGG